MQYASCHLLPESVDVCARLVPRLRDETDTAAIDAEVELMGNDGRDGQRTRLCGFDPAQKRFLKGASPARSPR